MDFEVFEFEGIDGKKITGYKWELPEEPTPRGIVQISHGMAEHAARYDGFAQALNAAGYCVYANDHRGHGKTAGSVEELGFFAEKNGWELVRDDMFVLTGIIKNAHKGLPVFVLGHSMGSFLTRSYLLKYADEIDGAILSGTAGDPGILGDVGEIIAAVECRLKGPRAKSPLMDKLSFGTFNAPYKPNRTAFDWLCTVDAEVDKYIADPFCGAVHTTSFFVQLLGAVKTVNDFDEITTMPKDIPIYIFSGALCLVGKETKGVVNIFQKYIKAGIKDVSLKFYGQARHECLNEANKEEVYHDVIVWLDNRCR
ncbi:MAG: alpha/beta hydrolase [Thermodesulfobacteriota bacterium]|nr:alpha/beta hydrolase [Thermodesulfobacteriota bacterium]